MLKGRGLTKETDLTPAEQLTVPDLVTQSKVERRERHEVKRLIGKKVALLFEKASTRTGCSFNVTMTEQGGYVTRLGTTGSQFVHGESVADAARMLDRWYDGIEYHGFTREIFEVMGRHTRILIYNGLTDS